MLIYMLKDLMYTFCLAARQTPNSPVLTRDVLVPFASMPIGGVCMVTAGRHRSSEQIYYF
jgi:hypothetical protein